MIKSNNYVLAAMLLSTSAWGGPLVYELDCAIKYQVDGHVYEHTTRMVADLECDSLGLETYPSPQGRCEYGVARGKFTTLAADDGHFFRLNLTAYTYSPTSGKPTHQRIRVGYDLTGRGSGLSAPDQISVQASREFYRIDENWAPLSADEWFNAKDLKLSGRRNGSISIPPGSELALEYRCSYVRHVFLYSR